MFPKELKLNEQTIRNFRVAKIFKENSAPINSMDFDLQGTSLISSSDDDQIVIYDCQNGQ